MTELTTYDEMRWGLEAFEPQDEDGFPNGVVYSRTSGGRSLIATVLLCSSLSLTASISDAKSVLQGLPDEATTNAGYVSQREVAQASENPAPSVAEQTETVLRAFGLPVSRAATLLHVSRPRIYAWKDGGTENIDEENRQRLLTIFELASQWERLSQEPLGNRLFIPFLTDRRSLFDVLSVESLTQEVLQDAQERIQQLANSPEAQLLAGDKASRWRKSVGASLPPSEFQESNLESNLRSLKDHD